tara:strand:+ start:734 stop:1456 length:723 start_codon:yes stop_codon:yes gene_type:complete
MTYSSESIELTILLPTFNESSTIEKMLDAIRNNLPDGISIEILIIDDNSPDGTSNIVNSYFEKSENNFSFKVHTRKNERGLSSAIIDGIRIANGKYVLIMDSDFSHPPQMIETMYHEIDNNELDIVIGSRYIQGGKSEDWPILRKLMSRLANTIPKLILGLDVNDSMSGFFIIKKELIKNLTFQAIGWKILLEILVKAKTSKIQEIPYSCKNRDEGESKFSFSIINDYFVLLRILMSYRK